MVIRELYKVLDSGEKLYRSYSDEGYDLRKKGTEKIYNEAIDIEDENFEYEEIIGDDDGIQS